MINGRANELSFIDREDGIKFHNDFEARAGYEDKKKEDLLWGLSSIEGENVEQYNVNDKVKRFINPSTGKIDIGYVNKNPLTTTIGEWESAIKGETNKKQVEAAKKEALTWVNNNAEKLDLTRSKGETDNDFANRVMEKSKVNQQKVIINKPLMQVGKSMDNLMIGKDGSKFTAFYDDAMLPGEKSPHPISEFIKNNNINPNTISHTSVSFDKEDPGYIMFTANNNNGEPIKFYAKSRDLNLKNSLRGVNDFVKTFDKFYSTDEIKHLKRTINGEKFTVVGDINSDNKINEYYAIDSESNPVLVVEDKSTGKINKYYTEQLKSSALNKYLNSPSGKIFTSNLKDRQNFDFGEDQNIEE